MRTLLRNTNTNLYCQGPDKWTANPDRAYDFRFTERAVQYSESWGLKDVELAFAYDDPQEVKTLPLNKVSCWNLAAA